MLYGLSLSGCVLDLMRANTVNVLQEVPVFGAGEDTYRAVDLYNVELSDIVVFCSCKAEDPDEWQEVFDKYSKTSWNKSLAAPIMAENLLRMGRILAPRNHGCKGLGHGSWNWTDNLEVVKAMSVWDGEEAEEDKEFYFEMIQKRLEDLRAKRLNNRPKRVEA